MPALAAARIDYALCGGLALAVHGHPRATEDIGLLIREDQLEPALQVLERAGYGERSGRMTFQGKRGEKVTMERVARIEGTDFLIPDLILVSSSLEQVWESRREVIFAELPLRVVSREGLDIPLAAEVSASKNYVWLTAYFGQIPTDFGDRPLKMLRANFEVQPSQFYITKSDKLMMGIALDNRNIHPAILRRNVDKVAKDVASTQALWTFDGFDQSGPQTQAR
ncbi:MAG: hypothetical protein EDM74_06955 [Armatimonadetes bacterium]|nr:MAG: hypothetical protein EDM74_06955 [Armatimonadota bacterium]